MALQSEVSPTIVGDPNKDTQIDGDTKSDHSSTDDEADLEDGEIAESEEEEEKDFSNVSLKEALDQSCLQNIEQLVNQAKNAKAVDSPERPKHISPPSRKSKRDYHDHDHQEGSEEEKGGWFPPSPKYKSKFGDKPIDYRMELAAYRGTPPSSPERRRERDEKKKKRSSKKAKKSKKTIRRKDIKGHRVANFKRQEAARGKICKFFKEGKCAKGADCHFSHALPPSFKKKDLCKFYLNGHCNKGKDCLYMHSEFPCKFYHTGSECYAKQDCRFSHAPLTEEMKKILADYLRSCHGDDVRHNRFDNHHDDHEQHQDHDRERDRERNKRAHSPEPPPQQQQQQQAGPPPAKRPCLLGSPPRHIREAEETRRWQDEMRMLERSSHPSFEIRLEGDVRPNFYQETLHPSPVKRPPHNDDNFYQCNDDYEEGSPSKVYVYDEDDFVEIDVPKIKQEPPQDEYRQWEQNVPQPVERDVKPFTEPIKQELDFTNDVKFDETTQFSEPDYPAHIASPDSLEDTSSKSPGHKQHPDDSTQPVMVPTHLPRRQQELLKRVLQHQRQNAASGSDSENQESKPKETVEIKKEQPEPQKFAMGLQESEWYTSEEEDDDEEDDENDGQLLKKIQQAPPKPVEAKPPAKVDLLAIFNTIQQKTLEKNKGLSNAQQKSTFWQNILGGVNASKTAAAAKEKNTLPSPTPTSAESSKHPLLPNPMASPTQSSEPIKDPRLKNRDPRKVAREPTQVSIPKSTIAEELASPPIKVTPPTDPGKESIPYKLRGITAKPPNYTPYLTASQSNPSLLKDPRLRKHLQSNDPVNGTEPAPSRVDPALSRADSVPARVAPPIPELLLKYEKPVAAINIFESSSSSEKSDSKPSINVSVAYDPSDSKGKVPIPVIPLVESKTPTTVPYDPAVSKSNTPVSYDPVVSKSIAPVSYDPVVSKTITNAPYDPVVTKSITTAPYDPSICKSITPAPYDPLISKSITPAPYDPLISKSITPAPYDPVISKSITPAPYDPSVCKSITPAPYDPVISKSITPAPYDPVISKSITTAPYDPSVCKSITPAPYNPVIAKSITPAPDDPLISKSITPVPAVSKSTEPVSRDPSVSKSAAPDAPKSSAPVPVVKDPIASNSTSTTKTSATVTSKSRKSPGSSNVTDSKVATKAPMELKKRKHIPVAVLEPKRSSPIPKVELPELFKVEPTKKCAPVSKRRESGDSKKRKSTSLDSKEKKRRDSHASNSGSDTPPHLTIVDSVTAQDTQHKSAPVLESELKKGTNKKKPPPKAGKEKKSSTKKTVSLPPPDDVEESIDNIKKEIVEESIDNIKKEIVGESIDNIKKEIMEESIDNIKKEIVEESIDNIRKEIVEESIDNIKKEIVEERKDNIKKDVEEENIENITKEILEDSTDKNTEEVVEENIDDIKKHIFEESIDDIKKHIFEESIDNIKKEIFKENPEHCKKVDSIEESIDNILKEIQSDSDNSNPPLLKPSHRKSPVVEEFMTVIKKEIPQECSGDSKPVVPPLIIKKVKPSAAASHLPKAIADPRMAKLHNPRRRAAASNTVSPRRTSGRRKAAIQAEAAIEADAAIEAIREVSPERSPKEETRSSPTKAKAKPKSIPKKRRLSEKTEEKKKTTVHRNRKSSMDYASPLNSCDALSTEDPKTTGYNRYNQRPKRGATVSATTTGKDTPTSDSVPEFALSDSSNLECDNSSDVNLKDRFKTIDPTASPFC